MSVETLLLELLAEVKGLRADLAEKRQPLSLSRADRALLGRLLPAVGGVFGSELFVARELFESDAAALKVVLGELNATAVGRVLRRAEGHTIDGYHIQRDGSEVGAVLWRVVRVPEVLNRQHLSVLSQRPRGLVE